jgi:arylsulfatase A-like enzyme
MRSYLSTPGLDAFEDARTLGGAADRAGAAWTVDDAKAVDAALRWIGSDRSAPYFAALNLQSAHLPFEVPAGFGRPFGGAAAGKVSITAAGFPREQAAAARDLYADALAYADAQIARLLEALDPSRTLVVVTSDHGEAFYEHGLAAHANGVWEEVVRVPLLVAGPGLVPGQETRPAGLLDLAPTLLGLLGLPPHPSHQGADLLGTEPVAEPRSRYLVSDTPWRTHLGLRRGRHKLVYDADSGRFALYDLEEDPAESRDVSEARPEEARDLRGRLAAWRAAQLAYYGNPLRQAAEYPPVLGER